MQTVGIIGTGEIGWRMGRLLMSTGRRVVAFDIRPAALRRPKDSGFEIADSVATLCECAEIVITCVTDGSALRDVIMGPAGVLSSLKAGRTVIDTTSAEPWITTELAKLLGEKGIGFLDAPVSGGVPAADAGTMNFMVGGHAALLDNWRPLLGCLGTVVTHVGPIGAGHTIKAINMLALASSMLATAEILAIGRKSGHRLDRLVDALNSGSGASFSTRVHFPRFIVPGNYASGFAFDLMHKDLSIAIGLAERLEVPLLLGRITWELYRIAAESGLRGLDNTKIVQSVLSPSPEVTLSPEITQAVQLTPLAEAANVIVAAEALSLGAAARLAPSTVIQVLSASSGDSHALSRRLPPYLEGKCDESAPRLAATWREASTILAAGLSLQVPVFLSAQAVAIHAAALRAFDDSADRNCVVDLIASWTHQAEASRPIVEMRT